MVSERMNPHCAAVLVVKLLSVCAQTAPFQLPEDRWMEL